MAKITMITAINQTLHQQMQKNDRIMVIGEDVGKEGGVFRATEGLQLKYGIDRVVDSPLSENGIIGTAIGLAINGMRPVTEIEFSGFMYYAFHQLKSNASKIRNRTRGALSCPLIVRAPYGSGVRALEEHSESTEALYVHSPGLNVVIPSTPYDAKGLLTTALKCNDPVIFLEPMRLYRASKEEVPDEEYEIPFGQARVVKEGKDVTIVAWGAMVKQCIQASEELAGTPDCEIIDLRTLQPYDEKTVRASVEKTGRLLIVHEAHLTCGFGAEIAARVAEKNFLNMQAPIKRVTGYDVPVPYAKLEDYYTPDANKIKKALNELMQF